MSDTKPLTSRSKDLRARALSTNALAPNSSNRMAQTITERREALDLLAELEQYVEGMELSYLALSSRVYELAQLATRGSNGHSWKNDLPQKENASAFYQALRALVRHLRERSS